MSIFVINANFLKPYLMKNVYLFLFLMCSIYVFSQKMTYGKLNYSSSASMSSEEYEGMRKIVFDKSNDNIVVINKIPNQSLPDLKNQDYSSSLNQENFLALIKEMAEKGIYVKQSDEMAAQITSPPTFVNTGKLFLTAYTVLNRVKSSNQEIREIYLTIPDKDFSYLIITTSFKHNQEFATKFQSFLDSLYLSK